MSTETRPIAVLSRLRLYVVLYARARTGFAWKSYRPTRHRHAGRPAKLTVSAHDVARELRARLPGGAGRAKIQKLLYYCQGWHLAHYGEPMFAERIEAWKDGPVVATLWADEQHDRPVPGRHEVSASYLDVLEYVVDRYGGDTGAQLIDRTHGETPWKSIAESAGWTPSAPSKTIEHESLRRFFSDEAEVARDRANRRQVVVLHSVPSSAIAQEQAAALQRGERVQSI